MRSLSLSSEFSRTPSSWIDFFFLLFIPRSPTTPLFFPGNSFFLSTSSRKPKKNPQKKPEKPPRKKPNPFILSHPSSLCGVWKIFIHPPLSPSTQVGQLPSISSFTQHHPFHSPSLGSQWIVSRRNLNVDRAHHPARIGASLQRNLCCAEALPCVWQQPHTL